MIGLLGPKNSINCVNNLLNEDESSILSYLTYYFLLATDSIETVAKSFFPGFTNIAQVAGLRNSLYMRTLEMQETVSSA